MTRKTIGRAALVIAGLLLFTGAPTRAAETTDGDAAVEKADTGKPLALTKPAKTRTHKASRTRASKHASKEKAAARQAKAAAQKDKGISAAIANANAQMTGPETRGEAAMSGAAPMEMAAADQLTELGKSLAEPSTLDEPRPISTQLVLNDQPQSALPVITPEPSARPAAQVSAASSGDAWAQSSLIGKIFIAFGGMLTLASAARMLIA